MKNDPFIQDIELSVSFTGINGNQITEQGIVTFSHDGNGFASNIDSAFLQMWGFDFSELIMFALWDGNQNKAGEMLNIVEYQDQDGIFFTWNEKGFIPEFSTILNDYTISVLNVNDREQVA